MNKPRVALIDDDPIFQLTASKLLQATGLVSSIIQFANGGQGLAYLEENASEAAALPEVILLDINMPLVDGWMFLDDYARIRTSLKKDITIYMVSSSIDPSDQKRAKSSELIRDYLIKPVSFEGFRALLQRYI